LGMPGFEPGSLALLHRQLFLPKGKNRSFPRFSFQEKPRPKARILDQAILHPQKNLLNIFLQRTIKLVTILEKACPNWGTPPSLQLHNNGLP